MDWRDKAACLTADPELFFPVGNTGPAVDQIEKAKAVCARCTVTEICLQYALETGQDSGVLSGVGTPDRRWISSNELAISFLYRGSWPSAVPARTVMR